MVRTRCGGAHQRRPAEWSPPSGSGRHRARHPLHRVEPTGWEWTPSTGVEPRIHPARFSLTSAQVKEKRTASTASTRAHFTAPPSTRCAPLPRAGRAGARTAHRVERTGWTVVRIVVRTGWTRCAPDGRTTAPVRTGWAYYRTSAHRVGALHRTGAHRRGYGRGVMDRTARATPGVRRAWSPGWLGCLRGRRGRG